MPASKTTKAVSPVVAPSAAALQKSSRLADTQGAGAREADQFPKERVVARIGIGGILLKLPVENQFRVGVQRGQSGERRAHPNESGSGDDDEEGFRSESLQK